MLLTKGEFKGILLDEGYANEIISELRDNFGVCETRSSLASGYVRKGYNYLAIYNGRFGIGITVRYRNTDSTRFCYKETLIYNGVTVEEIEEVIDRVFNKYGIEMSRTLNFDSFLGTIDIMK